MRSKTLEVRLKAFHLPSFLSGYEATAAQAEKAIWAHVRYLETLAEPEEEDRQNRRVEKLLREAKLPQPEKGMETRKICCV